MKYGNFYDLESLAWLNRHEGCACSIKECDVEKVNRLISKIREDREKSGYRSQEMSSLIPPVAETIIHRRTLKEAMTGKSTFVFSHRLLSAMRMKDVPVTIRKEALGLQPIRDCCFPTAYTANFSGYGGIPEDTRTVPSSSTHSSGHGNTRNPILCTESTPQKNGRDTLSNASRILSRQTPLSIGTSHSPFTLGKSWNSWSESCTENFSTDSVPACSYFGDTVWNGKNFPYGNGTC